MKKERLQPTKGASGSLDMKNIHQEIAEREEYQDNADDA